MNGFSVTLEARDPARNLRRAYQISAGTDLFGDWLIDLTYGRIGAPGRTLRHIAPDQAEARRLVRDCLRRRRTAPKRLGTDYRITRIDGDADWLGGVEFGVANEYTSCHVVCVDDVGERLADTYRGDAKNWFGSAI